MTTGDGEGRAEVGEERRARFGAVPASGIALAVSTENRSAIGRKKRALGNRWT